MQKFEITNAEGGTAVLVQVTPRAPRNQITGKDSDIVYVDLTSAADRQTIDNDLQTFIAQKLSVGRGKVAVASGNSIEKKIVIIMGLTPDEVEQRLWP